MFAASKTASVSAGGYQIQRSLRFNSADSAYLNRTPASATNRKTWTWSGWIKLTKNTSQQYFFGGTQDNYNVLWTICSFYQDKIYLQSYSGGFQFNFQTTQVFRDYSAWYHIVVAVDTTQATDTNRLKLYVNGNLVTSYVTASYPTQNADTFINGNWLQTISGSIATSYIDAYMTEVNFIDGQALTPSSFGETNAQTGVWQPKAYSGSYGTNGFYLNFSDNSNTTAATLGKDYSGNGNNWTPNNFSVTAGAGNDSLVDSPTSYGTDTGVGGEVRGNYATLNALSKGSQITLSNGNLDYSHSGTTGDCRTLSSVAINSGKWYCEHTCTTTSSLFIVGIALASDSPSAGYMGATSGSYGYYASNGAKYNNGNSSAYGASWGTSGDVIGIAFDADAGTLTFYKNGTSQGTAYTSIPAGQYVFGQGDYTGSTYTGTFNFGQRPFAYTAPSGYKALCTQNLPTPTIGATTATQAGKYYNAVTYAGTSATHQIPNGINMASNGGLVWTKSRSQAGADPVIYDSIRGPGYFLKTDQTASEIYSAISLVSFDSDGVTFGADTAQGYSNYAPYGNYVAWAWAAGGSGSTNTAGSITSTVSANTTSGFSVVTATAQSSGTGTFGHGLGAAPSMFIIKGRGATSSWAVYHISTGAGGYLLLNSTAAYTADSFFTNNTAPTSTVVTLGSSFAGYGTFVAYCFAEVAGYSKFGSWTGNGSADGPFVYTGFRPAYILWKRTDSSAGGDWGIVDATRNPSNVVGEYLAADTSGAGATYSMLDMVSNGFKIRWSDTSTNASGGTYIYMAFASNPFKYSLAR